MQENIWVWLQDDHVLKAILDTENGILRIYDENDKLILKRTGLKNEQLKEVERCIIKYGAERLGDHKKPFRFL